MNIKNTANRLTDFKYVVESLTFRTSIGLKLLNQSKFIKKAAQIETELSNTNWAYQFIINKKEDKLLSLLFLKLESVLDTYSSIRRLSSNNILDEIELFEIKKLAISSNEIKEICEKINLPFAQIPDLTEIVEILDPDRQNIPHFYIYSSYDSELANIRALINQEMDISKIELLRNQCQVIEDKIRESLCEKLKPYSEKLTVSLNSIAYIDLIFAKAQLAIDFNFVKPDISDNSTSFQGLFNPYIKEILQKQNKDFQAINITLDHNPCILTGINMGGKTVLLRTLGLAQYLFQYGFFVPAGKASICITEEIFMITGDYQSDTSGLSSFASEMMILNDILKSIKTNTNAFVLIDELARTTNPDEGRAIVNATIDILNNYHVMGIISTHYSNLAWEGRRLKIKGLNLNSQNDSVDFKRLSNYMDYSVVDELEEKNLKEALIIAKILGIDSELINKAKSYLMD